MSVPKNVKAARPSWLAQDVGDYIVTRCNFVHDCDDCLFLGQTIGGGRIVDLYAHENADHVTLIARYGNDGPEYFSTHLGMARPEGHAELWAAESLYRKEQRRKKFERSIFRP